MNLQMKKGEKRQKHIRYDLVIKEVIRGVVEVNKDIEM